MINLSGMPGVKDSITDLGSIPANSIKGIICVIGETKRGEAGKNYLIGTWAEFKRQLGGFLSDSNFPLQCKQALDSGSKLRVGRVFHLSDIDNISTIDGKLSSSTLNNKSVQSVGAVTSNEILTWAGSGSKIDIFVPDSTNPTTSLLLVSYNGVASETPSQAVAAIIAIINANTTTTGYSATNPSGATVVITADAKFGNLANGEFTTAYKTTSCTLAEASTTFDNGVYVGGAYIKTTLTQWNGSGSNFTLKTVDLSNPNTQIELVNYNGSVSEINTDALVAIAALINNNTLTTGYSAFVLPSNTLVVKKNDESGSAGNGTIANISLVGATMINAALKFSNGVTSYPDLTSNWTAKAVGSGYDGTVITITPSTNNKPEYVDIKIELPDSDLPQEIKGVKRVLTNAQIVSLNKQIEGVYFDNLTDNTLPIGTTILLGGEQNLSSITDADYVGSSISKVGFHVFNDVTDSMRLFNISRPTHEAALGLQQYLEARRDMRGRTYTPLGLTTNGLNDFRDGTGAYNHQPLDSFYLDLWVADVDITDPNNVEVKDYEINAGGFQCGNRSNTDNKAGEWISDSGEQYGKIKGVNGMQLNLGSPGNSFAYDNLYEKGVNAIINDKDFKIVNWGNRTTLLDTTRLLSKTNIADLCIFISREAKAISKKMNFQPNDITMFERLYLQMLPFIKDTLVSGRAIEGDASPTRGEGVWWHWLGDQQAKDLNDLKINKKSEIDAGKYRARFVFKPIAANEYIGLDIAPADSVTILNVSQISNLNG